MAIKLNSANGSILLTPENGVGTCCHTVPRVGFQTCAQTLQDVSGLTPSDGNIIIGDGANFTTESGATARASLGLTIDTDVQSYDANTAKYDDATANFTGTLQNNGSNVVVDTDIDVTVQGKTTADQTFVTKSTALSSNNDLKVLIDDRLQVANLTSAIGTTIQSYSNNLTCFLSSVSLPPNDGTSGQFLATDGAGNISFTGVDAGYTVCATTLFNCCNPVLDTSAGNYFKIRALSNTNVSVSGSGQTVAIDYLSSRLTSLSVPNNFCTEGVAGNTINDLRVGNRYRIDYKKVGDTYFGKIQNLGYYPSSETAYGPSLEDIRTIRCNARQHITCPTYTLGCVIENPYARASCRYLQAGIIENYCHQLGPTTYCNRYGMRQSQNRSLMFEYKCQQYVLVPGSHYTYEGEGLACTNGTFCTWMYYRNAYGLLYGFDASGVRCLHQIIPAQDTKCNCNRPWSVFSSCTHGIACGECCFTGARCPTCAIGNFRALGSSEQLDVMLVYSADYCICNTWNLNTYCYRLSDIVEKGRFNLHSPTAYCQNYMCLMPCNTMCESEDSGRCGFSQAWRTLTVTPNYDFDKHTVPMMVMRLCHCNNNGSSVACWIATKICKNPGYGCCAPPNDNPGNLMFCYCNTSFTGCNVNCGIFGGMGYCSYAGHDCSYGTAFITSNNEIFGWTGVYCQQGTGCCYGHYIVGIKDACREIANGWSFSNPLLKCIQVTVCGITHCCRYFAESSMWWWDKSGCHFAKPFLLDTNCGCCGYSCSVIYSATTTGTSYVQSYIQCCMCIMSCCTQFAAQEAFLWPKQNCFTEHNKCNVVIMKIDAEKGCIYSSAASCEATYLGIDKCGLNYDAANCCWCLGTQNWITTCGANTAPEKCFRFICDETGFCYSYNRCVESYNLYLTYPDACGRYMRPFGISPLSNTELQAI